ncbi:hypothetical protein C8A00DRAFT_46554 [Chaetomidium leptoderma]|uniref:Uncharacterized protein n=1 Tax=Chaetomidium leptoderma TaxID=669021 RepID=A0AAN6VEJ1_9PEZI|nr:hypothetical protein C8A00DRAFT_46554 [Chaetomidium leptoderma]
MAQTSKACILLRICSLLYESHIPSLEAFLLGNKHCFAIAATVLADTITKLLRRHQLDLFQHVRRLVIVGRMDSPYCKTSHGGTNPNWELGSDSEGEREDDEPEPIPCPITLRIAKRPTWHFSLPTTTDWDVTQARLHGFQFGSEHGRGAVPLTPKPSNGHLGDPDDAPASAAYDSDHHWRPLADLISQLPGLADLVYRCPSQFPPCLLKAMQANKKPARLHLQTFKLRSAYDDSATIDPHEWEIISSPCLHSIWLQYRIAVNKTRRVMWMVKQGPISPSNGSFANVFRGPVRPWNPITVFNQEQREALPSRAFPSDKGHLTHLKLDSDTCTISPQDSVFGYGRTWMEKWDNLTDFSLLRTLALVQPVSQAQLLSLERTRLPALTAFSLTCEAPSSTDEERISSRSDYFQTITAFLSGLPSLTALQVTAWDHAQQIFSFHSSRLERLSLFNGDPAICCNMQAHLTLEGLAVLVSSFPRLTDLSIPLKRSRGDSGEIALYRYIGEHWPNLRRLSLRLDCSPPHFVTTDQSEHDTPLPKPYPSGPGWPAVGAALNEDRDQYAQRECWVGRYRNGHLYDILINSALDASLARQIFDAVGGGNWMAEKMNNRVAVKGIGLERFWGSPIDPFQIRHVRDREMMQCFRRVWPDKKERSKGWFEDWESWGLQAE